MNRVMMLSVLCLLAQTGCQSAGRSSWLGRSSADDEKVRQAIAAAKEKPGLPPPSQQASSQQLTPQGDPASASASTTIDQHLSLGQNEIAEWYQDHQEYHLAAAKMHFDEVVAQQASNARAQHGLAIIADLRQDYVEAERHYQLALSQTPGDSNLLGDLGYSYLLQNRLSEAEKYLLRSVQADQSNRNATKHLGDVYARQGRTTLAEQTYAKVLTADEVRTALAENSSTSGQKQGDAVAATPAAESSGSIFDKLMPGKKNGEKLTSDIQKKLEEQRRSSGSPSGAGSVASANSPQSSAAQHDILREQLAAIDREGLQAAQNGPIYVDNQSGRTEQFANSTVPPSWPPVETRTPQQAAYEAAPEGVSPWPNGQIQQAGGTVVDRSAPPPQPSAAVPWSGVNPSQGFPTADQGASPYYQGSTPAQQTLIPPDPTRPLTMGSGQALPSTANPQGMPTRNPQTVPGVGGDPFTVASMSAARMAMGIGPSTPFPTVSTAPTVDAAGTNSQWNGNSYPQPHRVLPTDLAPPDLTRAYQPVPTGTPSPGNSIGTAGQANTTPMYSQQQFGTASRYDTQTLQGSNIPPAGHMDPQLQQFEMQRQESTRQLNQALQQVWGQGQMNNMVSPAAGTTYSPPPGNGPVNYPLYRPDDYATRAPGMNAQPAAANANTSMQAPPSTPQAGSGYVEPPPYRPGTRSQGTGIPAVAPAFPAGGNFNAPATGSGDIPNQYGNPSSMPVIIPGNGS